MRDTVTQQTLPRLTRRSAIPRPGIVHLGPGAFFRAFQAVYTQDAMEQTGGDWGIIAVSLRSPTARDQLIPQNCAYTAVTLGADKREYSQIESIVDVLVAPEKPEAVITAMTDPDIRIVSLTITEKGYCLHAGKAALDLTQPDIQHDIETPSTPKSAPGFIVEALARRRASGAPALTILSCDNLPSNGALAKAVVMDLARHRDAGLADWIDANIPFPSTMVDRITPATTDDDVMAVSEALGAYDAACVLHEPFRQWVIEDNFADNFRPAWETGGTQFVQSVDAHEHMKLRCLNGTHSTMAYLGCLLGLDTVKEAISDQRILKLCQHLWRAEIVPSLAQPEGEDLGAYTKRLLERYENSNIHHLTAQIAQDGSQKLPQRILAPLFENIEAERPCKGLAFVFAVWICSLAEQTPVDPLRDSLVAITGADDPAQEKVSAILRLILDADAGVEIGSMDTAVRLISDQLCRIEQQGIEAALEEFLAIVSR